jgi:hypothetical protein
MYGTFGSSAKKKTATIGSSKRVQGRFLPFSLTHWQYYYSATSHYFFDKLRGNSAMLDYTGNKSSVRISRK